MIYIKQHNTPFSSAYMFYACASYIHRSTHPATSLHTKPNMKVVYKVKMFGHNEGKQDKYIFFIFSFKPFDFFLFFFL